eukprot:TRINITY_DN35824_c0_g1_i1.p1 TRINITY_DN35824_c0_g1~~TRINITY_DN35824_c0_g1_i1.p1  ORF type:complete len:287 (+),score=55.70 TRINITY_DN35824_c0_g1_i1:40-861(+)
MEEVCWREVVEQVATLLQEPGIFEGILLPSLARRELIAMALVCSEWRRRVDLPQQRRTQRVWYDDLQEGELEITLHSADLDEAQANIRSNMDTQALFKLPIWAARTTEGRTNVVSQSSSPIYRCVNLVSFEPSKYEARHCIARGKLQVEVWQPCVDSSFFKAILGREPMLVGRALIGLSPLLKDPLLEVEVPLLRQSKKDERKNDTVGTIRVTARLRCALFNLMDEELRDYFEQMLPVANVIDAHGGVTRLVQLARQGIDPYSSIDTEARLPV